MLNKTLPYEYATCAKHKQELRETIRDITLAYPQLTASFMDKNIRKNMHKQEGGGLEKINKLITEVTKTFSLFEKLNSQKIYDNVVEITKILSSIQDILASVSQSPDVDASLVLNNLHQTLVTLQNLEQSKIQTHSMNAQMPVAHPPIDDKTLEETKNFTTLLDTTVTRYMSLLLVDDQYTSLFRILLNARSTEDLKKQMQLLNFPQIMNQIDAFHGNFGDLKLALIKLIKINYDQKLPQQVIDQVSTQHALAVEQHVDKYTKLQNILDSVKKSTETTRQYIYNIDEHYDGNTKFAVVGRHVVPSIKHVALIFYNYALFGENQNLKQISNVIFGKYKATPLGKSDDELMSSLRIIEKNMEQNGYEEIQKTESLMSSLSTQLEKFGETEQPLMAQFLKDVDEIIYFENTRVLLNNMMVATYKKLYDTTQAPDDELTQLKTYAIYIEKISYYGKILREYLVKKKPQNHRELTDRLRTKYAALSKHVQTDTSKIDWIDVYNYERFVQKTHDKTLMTKGMPQQIRMLPKRMFLGIYTETIYNDIFSDIVDDVAKQRAGLLANIIKDIDFGEMIFKPNFEQIKQHQTMHAGGPPKEDVLQVERKLTEMAKIVVQFNQLYYELDLQIIKYNVNYADIYNYVRLLILIATNQIFTHDYIVYTFVNKGIIEFYKRVLNKMVDDMNKGTMMPELQFIRKHYNVAIRRLHFLFAALSLYISDPISVIDIRGISDETLTNDFVLFNHMKNIIDAYNEMFQYKLSIYARLNDIKTEIDVDSKVFVSDYEHGGNDTSMMCIQTTRCDTATSNQPTDTNQCTRSGGELVKFTEIFDSVTFPENGDISKYMTIDTQLSKNKSICMLTYGYSGTGKTYTLFGNDTKQGMLQSTLTNINGLHSVKFRLFEIYGVGFAFDLYWNKGEQSRMEEINHTIFHYNLDVTPTDIDVSHDHPVTNYAANQFAAFMADQNTYITIDRLLVPTVFARFVVFTRNIDKFRKKNGRIIATPNNPESSRSILVYEFKLYVNGKEETNAVTFLVVDLPGRESIISTFCEQYLKRPEIQSSLKGEEITIGDGIGTINKNIEKVRMILTCMALNPMALAVFASEQILAAAKQNLNQADWDTILSMKINRSQMLSDLVTVNKKQLEMVSRDKPLLLYGHDMTNINQTLSIVAIFVMYHLIFANKIDLLREIYANIVQVHINRHIADKLLHYGYTTEPLEGIYINENIIGLIKYLADTLVVNPVTRSNINLLKKDRIKQKPITLEQLRNIARSWIMSDAHTSWENPEYRHNVITALNIDELKNTMGDTYTGTYGESFIEGLPRDKPQNNLYYCMYNGKELDYRRVVLCQRELTKSYVPSKIFNFDKPLITDVLAPFIKIINDFKVFYLFGNYDNDESTRLKCSHQIDLLHDSKQFIEAIVA